MDILEINTLIWLKEISLKYQREIKLDNIPEEEILDFCDKGFDAVWMMGIWQRSFKGAEIARQHEGVLNEFKELIGDIDPESDIGSSPYSIKDYNVDQKLGSNTGIKIFRKRLNEKGIKLLLDFVPNHMAVDHLWVQTKPQLFINADEKDFNEESFLYFRNSSGDIIAHGKDPYFDPWTDVAQLNYFNPETRKEMTGILKKVAGFCDGVRCDMAMLILKRIQTRIWGGRTKYNEPENEFWQQSISEIKTIYPEFIFVAEVYWNLEEELIGYGFDFVYDIDFYHALLDNDTGFLESSFSPDLKIRYKRLKFIENHDEQRSLKSFGYERLKAAAFLMSLSMGGHLYYQGQMEGFTKKLPVQLLKRPPEDADEIISSFYDLLFKVKNKLKKLKIEWSFIKPQPYITDDPLTRNTMVLCGGSMFMAVVNYSGNVSKIILEPKTDKIPSSCRKIIFKDMLSLAVIKKDRQDLNKNGLYLALVPYSIYLFKISGEQ